MFLGACARNISNDEQFPELNERLFATANFFFSGDLFSRCCSTLLTSSQKETRTVFGFFKFVFCCCLLVPCAVVAAIVGVVFPIVAVYKNIYGVYSHTECNFIIIIRVDKNEFCI